MSYIYIAEKGMETRAYTTEEDAKRHEEYLAGEQLEWHEFYGTKYGFDKEKNILAKIEEVEIII